MRKFSTLQLIGFAITLVWVFTSIYSDHNKSESLATDLSESAYQSCIETQIETKQTANPSCLDQKREKYETYLTEWSTILTLAFLPVPFFWIYGFILFTIVRCFRHGSKTVLDLSNLSIWKKGFAYFCYLFTGLTIFIFVIAAMVTYQKLQVPVSLSYNTKMYVGKDYSAGYATAEGTWIIKGDANKEKMINPLQTSRIVCRIQAKECIEARAEVMHIAANSSSYLLAKDFRYDVTSWTKDSIVFKDSGLCFDKFYTYDLNSKTIIGVEKFSAQAPKTCKRPEDWKRETTYELVGGYTVYEELSAKARPGLLRVFFSLFN